MIYRYYPYTLTLRSPLLVSTLDGDPNSALGARFIPGSALRGVVARGLGDPGADPEALARFRQLVLGGSVRYLNGYLSRGGSRALPAPLSLRPEKETPWEEGKYASLYDLAAFDGRPG